METSIFVPPQEVSIHFTEARHTLCPICGGPVTQNGPVERCLLCRYTYCAACEGVAAELVSISTGLAPVG
jgi:hypothetical protein